MRTPMQLPPVAQTNSGRMNRHLNKIRDCLRTLHSYEPPPVKRSRAGSPQLHRLWWNMSYDDSSDSSSHVTIYIDNGMCEGPDFISTFIHPERAWEHTDNEDEDGGGQEIPNQTVTGGVTNFYVKATFTESTTDMGGLTTDGITLTGYRYKLASYEVHKETGSPPDQPRDERLIKYKLLGQVTVEAGKVTEYWWRTNHIFNWTFYAWTADSHSDNSDALPPDVPPPPAPPP